jgi:hypothetical protein
MGEFADDALDQALAEMLSDDDDHVVEGSMTVENSAGLSTGTFDEDFTPSDAVGGIITTADAAKDYMLAGKAYFTLVSKVTGKRFTYRVARNKKPKEGVKQIYSPQTEVRFVSLLIGPDNWTNYSYIGLIDKKGFRSTAKAKIPSSAPSVQAFNWAFKCIMGDGVIRGRMPETLEFWHSGKCGSCGRKLTNPTSVAAGVGPSCGKHRVM